MVDLFRMLVSIAFGFLSVIVASVFVDAWKAGPAAIRRKRLKRNMRTIDE